MTMPTFPPNDGGDAEQSAPVSAREYYLPARHSNDETHGLHTLGGFIIALALLSAFGSIIAGAVLAANSGQDCGSGVFDCTQTHPYAGLGWGIIIGGLIQSMLIAAVGMIAQTVADIRKHQVWATEAEAE